MSAPLHTLGAIDVIVGSSKDWKFYSCDQPAVDQASRSCMVEIGMALSRTLHMGTWNRPKCTQVGTEEYSFDQILRPCSFIRINPGAFSHLADQHDGNPRGALAFQYDCRVNKRGMLISFTMSNKAMMVAFGVSCVSKQTSFAGTRKPSEKRSMPLSDFHVPRLYGILLEDFSRFDKSSPPLWIGKLDESDDFQ